MIRFAHRTRVIPRPLAMVLLLPLVLAVAGPAYAGLDKKLRKLLNKGQLDGHVYLRTAGPMPRAASISS
jgi:hypothetical protein